MRKAFPALMSFVLALLATPANAWGGIPEATTPRGHLVQKMLETISILGIITFMIVFVWLVVVIVRFREGTGHGRATHEKERHNLRAEIIWVTIPLITVLWIGYAAYGGLVALDHEANPKDAKLDVLVTGSQWDWAADYGNNAHTHCPPSPLKCDSVGAVVIHSNPDVTHGGAVAEANVFVVPADVSIHFNITSSDVIHAWQVIDANRAYVMFVDANPGGANRYNSQTVSLPAGEYLVQCNKMCLNPGHAYMHAVIRAVPQAAYDSWILHQHAMVKPPGFSLSQYDVTVTASGLSLPHNLTAIALSHVVLNVTNPTESAVTFSYDGIGFAQVSAGAHTYITFDIATAGDHNLMSSNGGAVAIKAVAAIPMTVDLGAFHLEPDHLALEVGKTYLITVRNMHSLPHNLYIGHHGGDVLESSATITPGGTDGFLVTPTTAGDFEMWCNVPGHYESGMHGTVTIT